MSALAPERTEWRGEDVELDEVAAQLMRLNREHAHHAHGHAATRTLNLLVACGGDVAGEQLTARLDALAARQPSRTIVLREHAADRLDAHVAIDCTIAPGPGATGHCHDAVTLTADAERLRHADSLVHALLVGGLPTVLWLPGARPTLAERALTGTAPAVVLDSDAAPDLAAGVARALRLGAARVRDLAWVRLTRWRQRIAGRFEAPEARALLTSATQLEVRCAAPDEAAPLLLAGWIVARAGWRPGALARTEAGWHASARRADGGEVEVLVGAAAGTTPACGIEAVAFAGPGGTALELFEPVAEPDAARAFATALRTFDEPARGYAPALAALAQGLDAR